MAIKASEISDLIKARIDKFASATEERNVGTVVTVTDGIVRIHGLADVKYGEMLEFPGGSFGLALNLEQDSVGAVVLGEYKHITEGDTVKTTGRILEVPVGEGLLGRVVDALGTPIDGKGPIKAAYNSPIERVADVEVVSATELNDAQRARLTGVLKKRLQREVRLHVSVDPALIGGAIARSGDLVIDGSLRARLERLASAITQ